MANEYYIKEAKDMIGKLKPNPMMVEEGTGHPLYLLRDAEMKYLASLLHKAMIDDVDDFDED